MAADVYLLIRCRTAPNIQCKAELIRANKHVRTSLHCVGGGGDSLLGSWRVQREVTNRMPLCTVSQLSAIQRRRERWDKKRHEVREMDR